RGPWGVSFCGVRQRPRVQHRGACLTREPAENRTSQTLRTYRYMR
ncbi:hypothetical protein GOSPT_112_00010, partial [Gordonia sputi NBRC 100414]